MCVKVSSLNDLDWKKRESAVNIHFLLGNVYVNLQNVYVQPRVSFLQCMLQMGERLVYRLAICSVKINMFERMINLDRMRRTVDTVRQPVR
jgi:hypothetical protein